MASIRLITCFSAMLLSQPLYADVATKQGQQIYLYYFSPSSQQVNRAKCSDPHRPIYNRSTCEAGVQTVGFPALREALEAEVGRKIPNLESRISERIARIVEIDQQLLDYFEGSDAEEESIRLRRRMESLRDELGNKESEKFSVADQIARIQAQLAESPSDDLRNLLAARRQELELIQADIARLSDDLSRVTEEFIQAQSRIISEDTFVGLTKSRDLHADQLKALREDLNHELQAVAAMRRLLAYVKDDGNVYEIRTEGQAFSELFYYLDLLIAEFNKLSRSPGPVGPGGGTGAWIATSDAVEICSGAHWPSDVAVHDGSSLVSCAPKGSQRTIPSVKFVSQNQTTSSQELLQSDGHYYQDIFLSNHRGRFQAAYQYNCSDDGTWLVGWGWGCIDFREWSVEGQPAISPLVFGRTGHNGHPVLDYNGDSYGVAWVSYDDFYFREITSAGRLVGRDRLDNILIGKDPRQSDSRDAARTQIVWNESLQKYGVFNLSGKGLFFNSVDRSGAKVQETTEIESKAFSNHFKGQVKAIAAGDAYFILFYDYRDLVLARYSETGQKLNSVVVLEGDRVFPSPITHQLDFPSMTLMDNTLIVVTSEPDTNIGKVFAYDLTLAPVTAASGLIGSPPMVMYYPRVAYDEATDELAIVYKTSEELGSSFLVRLKEK